VNISNREITRTIKIVGDARRTPGNKFTNLIWVQMLVSNLVERIIIPVDLNLSKYTTAVAINILFITSAYHDKKKGKIPAPSGGNNTIPNNSNRRKQYRR